MPTLENDELIFRFPTIEPRAQFAVSFMRTLRIPDTEQTYYLPPGLGVFPLRHVEDCADSLPPKTCDRGGVILPMWQAEAMWMDLNNDGPDWIDERTTESGSGLPVAVKIAAGKINAISGEVWSAGLNRNPQDYIVSPGQPWIDGFNIGKGVIRQFVAMPLGEGYSVEEQLTQAGEWGGVQISVTPLKRSIWQKLKNPRSDTWAFSSSIINACSEESQMGLGAGGRMHQDIYEDMFQFEDWDWDATDRVFVSLIHAKDWMSITGERAQNEPPTAKDYTEAGLPWFDYYDRDRQALAGSETLANVKSTGKLFEEKTGAKLVGSSDVATTKPISQGPTIRRPRPIRSAPF